MRNACFSESSSSSSGDERPSFGGSAYHGCDMGNQRPPVESSSSSDNSLDTPGKKLRLGDDSDYRFVTPSKKMRPKEIMETPSITNRTVEMMLYNKGLSKHDQSLDTNAQVKSEFRIQHMGYKTNSDLVKLDASGGMEEPEGEGMGERMMAKMGYRAGGLGKHGQGRLEPVEASMHKGRRGLGHYNDKLKEAKLRWNPDEEVVSIQEDVEWLTNSQQPLETKELNRWMGIGPAKKTITDECSFCDPNIVSQVVNSKSIFDNLDSNEMRRARTRSNPYETIRSSIFLNRAAVKMANMDKACDFMFTRPDSLKKGELLYFADVCAGPGGFSEYVLYREQWKAKGFGFTLRESNDFKLYDFHAGSPESFHPYYGPKEDGDVYNAENQEAFKDLIMRQTKNKGVHFMMADGGFSVEGQENIQEILSKQLYLCQCLVALKIVRKGGNFVTKVFDLFTPFSAGLVYLMNRCFESISIFKPNTSRPANSERYLICKGKRENVQDTIDYLARANHILNDRNDARDVTELVPHDILTSDVKFFEFLKNSNDTLGKKQVVGLLKIAAYCEDSSLFEHRQADIRKQCLAYWELPNKARTRPRYVNPDERLRDIIKNTHMRFFSSKATVLTTANLQPTILKSPYDWFCMPCGDSIEVDKAPSFYMSLGRSKTFRYQNGTWISVHQLRDEPTLDLPAGTLVYAELVPEFRGEARVQLKTFSLHILDAYTLGKEDVSRKCLEER